MIVVSVVIYGVNCFPIFASVALRSLASCMVGAVYTWTFTAAYINTFSACGLGEVSDAAPRFVVATKSALGVTIVPN